MERVFCIQCWGAWRLIFAKISYKYLETYFNPSGELRKLSDNPYKRTKSPILYITWNNWLRTSDVRYKVYYKKFDLLQ